MGHKQSMNPQPYSADDMLNEVLNDEFSIPLEELICYSPRTAADIRTFEKLFQAQRHKLTSFINKHMRNRSSVEDLVQQSFIEAFRCWHKFRGDSKPETWLFGIALNVVRSNVTRSAEYRYQFESTDEAHDFTETEFAEDPLQIILKGEMIIELQRAIETLPESMGEVVQLIVLDGYSYEEAAQVLHLPAGTIRSRLSRAREILRLLI
jgi:RNA polymerase sigma-70 factor (ECF subfamily)